MIARRCRVSPEDVTASLIEGVRAADESITNYYRFHLSSRRPVLLLPFYAVLDRLRLSNFVYQDLAEIRGPQRNWQPDFRRGVQSALDHSA